MARDRAWSRIRSEAGRGLRVRSGPTSAGKGLAAADVASSSATADPTLTLKLGNVCFDLIPENAKSTVHYQQSGNAPRYQTLRLQDFTGTLRVVLQQEPSSTTSESLAQDGTAEPTESDCIEEDGARVDVQQVTPKKVNNTKRKRGETKVLENNCDIGVLSDASDSSPQSEGEKNKLTSKRLRPESPFSLTVEEVDDALEAENGVSKSDEPGTSLLGQPDLSQTVSCGESSNASSCDQNSHDSGRDLGDGKLPVEDSTSASTTSAKTCPEEQYGMGENHAQSANLLDMDEEFSELGKELTSDTGNKQPNRVSMGGGTDASCLHLAEQSPPRSEVEKEKVSDVSSPALSVATTTALALPDRDEGPTSPSPRWGHTFTKVGDNRLIVYGGQTIDSTGGQDGGACVRTLNDFFIYQASDSKEKVDGKWIRPVNWNSALPRQWHTATYIPDQQLLLVFGGESGKKKSKGDDQVMLLDLDIMVWYPPSVSGQAPSARSGHSATLLCPPMKPAPTSATSARASYLVVFGGVGTVSGKWNNNVAVLDTNRWIWFQPRCQGTAPLPRSYHTATCIGGNQMVVFGGNCEDFSFDTVHVLTVATHDPDKPETEAETKGRSKAKKKKTKHSVPQQYQQHTWTWSHPTVSGPRPAARTGHSAAVLEDGKTICIYGGWDPTMDDDGADETGRTDDGTVVYDDCFLLDTSEWKWSRGRSPAANTKQRVGHDAICQNNRVHIFGGRTTGNAFLGDMTCIEA